MFWLIYISVAVIIVCNVGDAPKSATFLLALAWPVVVGWFASMALISLIMLALLVGIVYSTAAFNTLVIWGRK